MHREIHGVRRGAAVVLSVGLILWSLLAPAVAAGDDPAPRPYVVAQAAADAGTAEKEAFEAAKELGTVEAWQAFLKAYATGFRADLARAYIAKLGSAQTAPALAPGAPVITPPVQQTVAPPVQPLVPPPPQTPSKLTLVDLGPGIAPWQNGSLDLDDGNRMAYVAQVAGNGMELVGYCQPPETKKGASSLALRLRENPRGVYPFFDERLQQGIDGSPAAGADFKQIALRFDDGSVFGVTGRVFGMTGELEITENGKNLAPTGKILESMMSERTMTVLADPFSGTFQLTNSRPALCSVLAACGVKISACKGISAPKISKQIITQPKLVVPQTTKVVPPPSGFVPSQQGGFVPAPKPFIPLASKGGGTSGQGGATLVIQQTATGPCPGQQEVRNTAGQCVCDTISTRFNGKCVVACIGNATGYDANGKCTCPAGQVWDGACLTPTNEGMAALKDYKFPTCPDGRLKDVNGNCTGQCATPGGKLGGGIWNGQKCIAYDQMKDQYCGDLGLPADSDPAKEGRCKANPGGGLTVKLVPGGTKTKGTGGTPGVGVALPQLFGQGDGQNAAPVLQLFQGLGVFGGTQTQGSTAQPKVVTCTGGQVPQANGTCACPSGQQLVNGKCAATTFTATKPVACVDGYQLGADGKCTCRQIVNGQCMVGNPFVTLQNPCTGGAQTGADGKCACPSGQTFDGKTCVVDKVVRTQDPTGGGGVTTQKVTCTGGQLPQKDGSCACTGGQALVNGKCPGTLGGTFTQTKTTITCTGGQIPQAGGCACPGGQQFTGGKCVAQGGGNNVGGGLPTFVFPGGGGGTFMPGLSDRRAKTDVSEIATLPNGIHLYAFRYLSDDTMRVGVMAQDLLADERTQSAVHAVDGLYRVDYAALGLRMATLAEWRERGMAAVLAGH